MSIALLERPGDEPVLQPRCVYCKLAQPAAAVTAFSHGNAGCAWCRRVPPVFYRRDAYRQALREWSGL